MNEGEYRALSDWFGNYMGGFGGRKGLPAALELKRAHSLRTAENAALIAAGLRLAEGELRLARAAGLLHDAGRFTQFARYGSFRDADTLDHGLEGFRVLQEGLPPAENPVERDSLLCAVRYHNRKTADIPAGLKGEQSELLKLVRDADKLDIMGIVLGAIDEDGFSALPEMLPNISLSRELSPGILDKAIAGQPLSTGKLATLGDFLVMITAWFHDLNYAPSGQLAARRGILPRLRRELGAHSGAEKLFEDIEKALSGAA